MECVTYISFSSKRSMTVFPFDIVSSCLLHSTSTGTDDNALSASSVYRKLVKYQRLNYIGSQMQALKLTQQHLLSLSGSQSYRQRRQLP